MRLFGPLDQHLQINFLSVTSHAPHAATEEMQTNTSPVFISARKGVTNVVAVMFQVEVLLATFYASGNN